MFGRGGPPKLAKQDSKNDTENLQVTVHTATQLFAANKDGTSDPYVVLKLGKSKNSKKTSTKQATLNPVWEEELNLKLKNLKNGLINDQLDIVIFDHNVVETNKVIGRVLVPLKKLAKGASQTDTFPVVHPKQSGQAGSLKITVARVPKPVTENALVKAVRKKMIATMLYAKLKMASWGIEAEISVEAKVVFVKMILKVSHENEKKTLEELEIEALNALREASNEPLEGEEQVSVDDLEIEQPSKFKKALDKSMEKLGETLKITKEQFVEHGLTGAVAAGFIVEFAEMELQLMVETGAKKEDLKKAGGGVGLRNRMRG